MSYGSYTEWIEALYNIMVFVMDKRCVLCEVEAELLCVRYMSFGLQSRNTASQFLQT